MKKMVVIIAIIVVLVICATIVMLRCTKTSESNTEKNTTNVEQQVENQHVEKQTKYYDVVYDTEIDFSDTVPNISNDGKSIVMTNDQSNEKVFNLNGFEGNIKSVKTTAFEGVGEYHEVALLNTDGKVFVANADGMYQGGDLNLQKIDMDKSIKALGYTNSFTQGSAGKILLLTDNNEVYVIEDGNKAQKFDFENEKQYGKIFLDLVGTWSLNKSLSTENIENEYIFGTDLQFGEHEELQFETKTGGITGNYEIIPENNTVVISYEYGETETQNLVYNEATDSSNAYLKYNGDNGVYAVWEKCVSKIDETKDYVYTQFSEKSNDYSYDIPFVNINSIDAQSVNDDIQNAYLDEAKEELANNVDGLSITMYKVEYECHVNDDILSLVVSKEFPNDCVYYKTYNINTFTGKKLSNKDLLELKKISEDEFLNKMKDTVTKYVEDNFSNLKKDFYGSKDEPQSYLYILENTLDRCSIELPMFLDENRDINYIIDVNSIAGADAYSHIMK